MQMRQMACHALYTFPVSLAYNPITGKISDEYNMQLTLPMLALRRRADAWANTVAESVFDEASVAALRGALGKRIVVNDLFERPADADLLIKMSGGVLRDLLQMITNAATYSRNMPRITPVGVQSAIADLRSHYTDTLDTRPHDYRCLAAYARRDANVMQDADFSEQINRLLFNGSLLRYLEDGKPWLDAHPVLVETEEFRHACAAHDHSKQP